MTMTDERAAKEAAIERVQLGREAWIEEAVSIIRDIALTRRPFTTDDVWRRMTTDTDEPRAMGAAMRRAKSLGVIESTGEWTQSERSGCHQRPVAVWRGV